MLKIRKVHILARHIFNMKDHNAGIFFEKENEGMDWLWNLIEETVQLYKNVIINHQNFARLYLENTV